MLVNVLRPVFSCLMAETRGGSSAAMCGYQTSLHPEVDYPLGTGGRCLGAPKLSAPPPWLLCLVDPAPTASSSFQFETAWLKGCEGHPQMHVSKGP